jgi:tetratricopeptide (TPR) repeat protein
MSGSDPRSRLLSLRKRLRPTSSISKAATSGRRERGGLQQAIEYFQQAIDKDPAYARDYAGLAEAYALMGG